MIIIDSDVLIDALAGQQPSLARLENRNQKHFQRVPGLTLASW